MIFLYLGIWTFNKPFLKNYINIKLDKVLQSTSKNYVKSFIEEEKKLTQIF